jgi:hypothetical protein
MFFPFATPKVGRPQQPVVRLGGDACILTSFCGFPPLPDARFADVEGKARIRGN